MTVPPPPRIFDPHRRKLARRRAARLASLPQAATYLIDDMVEDVVERLAFLQHQPKRSLIIGDTSSRLANLVGGLFECAEPADGFADEAPFPTGGFDFIASLATLDTVNDLPGALIHIRKALAPGGLAIASLVGAGSLPGLRAAMLAADGDRPAPRLHPMIDVRAGGQLLQRAGWANPVVDSRALTVRFARFEGLVEDLRSQGLSNVLTRHGPALNRSALERARTTFGEGRLEHFEIITLSGWCR